MQKIYSKKDKEKLISVIIRYEDISEHRTDLSPANEYLQISARKLKNKLKIKAHKHKAVERRTDITQEAWIVFEGKIKAVLYDLDDSVLFETQIKKGDCIVFFRGGHGLEALEEETVFYEFKTGPYLGQKLDKEEISD